MNHDACRELAQLFLETEGLMSEETDVADLATAIQSAVENWFFVWEHERQKAKRA